MKIGNTSAASPCTDKEVMDIRIRQNSGEKRNKVKKDYLHLSDKTFYNVWDGRTKTNIFPK